MPETATSGFAGRCEPLHLLGLNFSWVRAIRPLDVGDECRFQDDDGRRNEGG